MHLQVTTLPIVISDLLSTSLHKDATFICFKIETNDSNIYTPRSAKWSATGSLIGIVYVENMVTFGHVV